MRHRKHPMHENKSLRATAIRVGIRRKRGHGPLALNGKVGWDRGIKPISCDKDTLPVNAEPLGDAYHPECPAIAFFECPQCSAVEPSTEKAFQYKDPDAQHKCIVCQRKARVRYWKCTCRKLWHNREEHSIAPVYQPLCTPVSLPTTYRYPAMVLEEGKGDRMGNL